MPLLEFLNNAMSLNKVNLHSLKRIVNFFKNCCFHINYWWKLGMLPALKVEKILKGSLDLISSPSVKIQIMGNVQMGQTFFVWINCIDLFLHFFYLRQSFGCGSITRVFLEASIDKMSENITPIRSAEHGTVVLSNMI